MAAETLSPAPRSRREKTCEVLAVLGGYLGFTVANVLHRDLGFWPSLLIGIGLTVPTVLFFNWLALPERRARLASDAERGLIECATRRPNAIPGSLQDRWKPGYAEVRDGTIRFQALYVDTEPSGPISTFSLLGAPKPVAAPAKRPADVRRQWKIVSMETDQGPLQLAASDNGLKLLEPGK
ncbi:hypothetical protein ACFRAU_25060 [Arthrobacter sp. NPDC056691]|uniref:hypothetical protein n=1 Tax=Arthrobacter sp. NPDC056691 TaxID=3345913 RepID=UPI00366A5D96